MLLSLLFALALLRMAVPGIAAQARNDAETRRETYASVAIDADGHLEILKEDGQRIVVRKEGDQTAFSTPAVSSARTAVGAQAMFANCCTSYDIPLQLVVYAAGKVHRFKGAGWPIFQWGFADGGTRVAYGQEPVHFACETHYELRDVESERLIEEVDVPQPCGQIPEPTPVPVPAWVAKLISKGQ